MYKKFYLIILSNEMGIGDWGLGIGDWAQSPIPNPQSPFHVNFPFLFFNNFIKKLKFYFYINFNHH
jgi:hypothetical protein